MVQRVATVAFEGIEARAVDVQVQVAPGLPAFNVVGLPDKAVSEAASGCAPRWSRRPGAAGAPHHRQSRARRPAEGRQPLRSADRARPDGGDRRHPADALAGFMVLGELGLDGSIAAVAGVLPAAIGANARGEGLICPAACGPEAAWAGPEMEIIARGIADPARQSFQRHAGARAAAAEDARGRQARCSISRHQGPGERQARARNRRGRRPQPADDRPARRRQVDAGGAAAVDSAAAHAARTARSVDDRLGRRRDRRRRAHQPPPVPRAASFRLDAGAGRRRLARAGRAKSRSRINGVLFLDELPEFRRGARTRCASRSRAARW